MAAENHETIEYEQISEPPRPLPDWPELASEVVGSVSRIIQAELHLIEASVRNIVSTEVDRVLKALIALVLIASGLVCAAIAIIMLLHLVLGVWWGAFAVVAGVTLIGGIGLFMLGPHKA
jgi:uncharacterized membrane protein YdjX (TVP38/TMEM64 family)